MTEHADIPEGDNSVPGDDMELFEWFIEKLGGREQALETLDAVLRIKRFEAALKAMPAELILSHPEIDWEEPIPLNTVEGQGRLRQLKGLIAGSIRRAINIANSPDSPDA